MTPQTLTPITNSQIAARHVNEPRAVHWHAGIVASDVQFAEIAFGFRQRVEHRLLLRDVDPHRHDPFVGAGEAVSRLFDHIFLDVSHDHVRTRFRKRGRDAEANAGSGAGDDGGLA